MKIQLTGGCGLIMELTTRSHPLLACNVSDRWGTTCIAQCLMSFHIVLLMQAQLMRMFWLCRSEFGVRICQLQETRRCGESHKDPKPAENTKQDHQGMCANWSTPASEIDSLDTSADTFLLVIFSMC